MTETTEEKKEYTAEEIQDLLEKSCAAIAKSNAPLAAIENLTSILDIFVDQSTKISKLNDGLEAQVTSLTKERDELKRSTAFSRKAAADAVKKIRSLKSQLSNRDKEIENGKPIEEAPTDGTPVLAWKTGSSFQPYTQHCEDGVWGRLTSAMGFEPSREQPDKFIYLPVTTPGKLASWRPDLLQSKGEEE